MLDSDKLKKLQVAPTATFRETIEVIDRGASRVALVAECEILVGIVTDGDIRRGLLDGYSLDSSISSVMQKGFRVLPPSASRAEARDLMLKESLLHIPIVDEVGKIVDLFVLHDLLGGKGGLPNNVLIMAGGQGKRLRPLTLNCPKPMLPVAGRPILECILESCLDAGFEKFYFSVNYLAEHIQSYFKDGAAWGAQICYLHEEKALGTAGAIGLIPQIPKDPILVLNGDILTRVDYKSLLQFHSVNNCDVTLCVRDFSVQVPFGVARTRGIDLVEIEEKPTVSWKVNAGIYVLNSHLMSFIPKNEPIDMPDFIHAVARRGMRVSCFPVHEYWLDIGRPECLEEANRDWQ